MDAPTTLDVEEWSIEPKPGGTSSGHAGKCETNPTSRALDGKVDRAGGYAVNPMRGPGVEGATATVGALTAAAVAGRTSVCRPSVQAIRGAAPEGSADRRPCKGGCGSGDRKPRRGLARVVRFSPSRGRCICRRSREAARPGWSAAPGTRTDPAGRGREPCRSGSVPSSDVPMAPRGAWRLRVVRRKIRSVPTAVGRASGSEARRRLPRTGRQAPRGAENLLWGAVRRRKPSSRRRQPPICMSRGVRDGRPLRHAPERPRPFNPRHRPGRPG